MSKMSPARQAFCDRMRTRMLGDKNPMRRPAVAAKVAAITRLPETRAKVSAAQ